jgi:lipopolysaccharide/colanic/teichoic acid biosynthesis glycosyltransferase
VTAAEFAAEPIAVKPGGPSFFEREIRFSVSPSSYFRWRNGVGRAIALLLLIPGLPLIGVLILLARRSTGASGLYRQQRVGKNGKSFAIYKIRSMRADAEKDGAQWSTQDDDRVTKLGRFLRKVHLDELPQLINVLKGEMALIGPRPERPEFVPILARAIPDYLDRLAVLPGVTGLAQINLPPDVNLNCVRRKLVLDLEYIESANLWQDIRILLCTFVRLLGVPGDRAMELFGLRRFVDLHEAYGAEVCLSPKALRDLLAAEAKAEALETKPAEPHISVAKPR